VRLAQRTAMVRYGDGEPDPYCGCEGCFSYWLQTFADGRPDGFDLYWEECLNDNLWWWGRPTCA
jgi:hypothetical protein